MLRLRFVDFARVDALAHAARGDREHDDAAVRVPRAARRRATPLIERRGLTLLGISLTNLADARRGPARAAARVPQASALDAAVDDVRDRYGADAIKRAVLLGRDTGLEVPLLPD